MISDVFWRDIHPKLEISQEVLTMVLIEKLFHPKIWMCRRAASGNAWVTPQVLLVEDCQSVMQLGPNPFFAARRILNHSQDVKGISRDL